MVQHPVSIQPIDRFALFLDRELPSQSWCFALFHISIWLDLHCSGTEQFSPECKDMQQEGILDLGHHGTCGLRRMLDWMWCHQQSENKETDNYCCQFTISMSHVWKTMCTIPPHPLIAPWCYIHLRLLFLAFLGTLLRQTWKYQTHPTHPIHSKHLRFCLLAPGGKWNAV